MRKWHPRIYFPLLFILVASISLPGEALLPFKSALIAIAAPVWSRLQTTKQDNAEVTEKIHDLELENLLLKNALSDLQDVLSSERSLEKQWKWYREETADSSIDYLRYLRKEIVQPLIQRQLQGTPAQVIYRSPEYWSNSLWIDIGSTRNSSAKRLAVAKGSPVVIGTTVVGVVDHVEAERSRVRLITDPGVIPSVRVMRMDKDRPLFLAKGELRGSVKTSWRQRSAILKGTGFNYDYADEEGPARDLRTGDPVKSLGNLQKTPLIQEGDLLITSGMDGIFPKGLRVAQVSSIQLLREGDYYYEIEATSCLEHFDDLHVVYVLPPIS